MNASPQSNGGPPGARAVVDGVQQAGRTVRVSRTAGWLALGAVAGPVLYEITWIALGLVRDGFSSTEQVISDLGVGSHAVLMNGGSVIYGLLVLVGVAGVFLGARHELRTTTRWICTVLLALAGVGGILEGVFSDQSSSMHAMGFVLAFVLTPALSFPVVGTRLRRIPQYRRFGRWLVVVGCPLSLALAVLFLVSASAAPDLAGLTARVVVVALHIWYVVLGLLAFRRRAVIVA